MIEKEFTDMIRRFLQAKDYYTLRDTLETKSFKKTLHNLCILQSRRLETKQRKINIGDTVYVYTLTGEFVDKVIVNKGYKVNKECWKAHHNTVYDDDSRVSLPCCYNYKSFTVNFSRLTGKQVGYKEQHYKHLPDGMPHKYYIVAEKWSEQIKRS